MARAFSTSPSTPFVICCEVFFTMPSVRTSIEPSRYLASVLRDSGAGLLPGFARSTKRSRVANRVVTSMAGAGSPAAHSAYSMPAPYFSSRSTRATVALPVHVCPRPFM
jgi:hypothetical protein